MRSVRRGTCSCDVYARYSGYIVNFFFVCGLLARYSMYTCMWCVCVCVNLCTYMHTHGRISKGEHVKKNAWILMGLHVYMRRCVYVCEWVLAFRWKRGWCYNQLSITGYRPCDLFISLSLRISLCVLVPLSAC